jgi:serine/threonine protein phosphatase PrpC
LQPVALSKSPDTDACQATNTVIGVSHPGRRHHNEDCIVADADMGLAMVADGMGGYACGDVASDIVKTVLLAAVAEQESLMEGIARAHAAITTASTEPNKKGMGSTVVAIKLSKLDYELAWVGDSRAYLWDGLALKQITRDHSYVETLIGSGAISYQQSLIHPERNLITQAVGVAPEGGLDIAIANGRLQAGQIILLCSDGLVDEVVDSDVAAILAAAPSLQQALDDLLAAAIAGGGRDNISIVLWQAGSGYSSTQSALVPEVIRSTPVAATATKEMVFQRAILPVLARRYWPLSLLLVIGLSLLLVRIA